ncbi:MAG TPA: outer membrane protein assembly factor BamD [Terriglobia bacterium]|nr:outer membrane protein assembly factor BamD [Terriglobia bacterium]
MLFKRALPIRKCLAVLVLLGVSGCGGKQVPLTPTSGLIENDKDLFETAMKALRKNRFTEAQLQLQVLLETYEDSEYSAQAKYAYADSFYYQAGHSNLLSAESEFRKFITFFPTHELADDAQLKVAMTHIKQLQRPDRDNSEAKLAEYELNLMINDYPSSPLLDEAKAKLRAVQEILAEGILGPAKQYYKRGAYPAVVNRCEEILKKYPDFTGTDRVLFLLAETIRKVAPPQSATYYTQIVRDYPLSPLVKESKKYLTELQAAIPEPNPVALNLAQKRLEESKNGGGLTSIVGLGFLKGDGGSLKETNAVSSKDPQSTLTIIEGTQ